MKQNKTSVLGPVKKVAISLLTAIALILVIFVIIYCYNREREINDKIIMNQLGIQRRTVLILSENAASLEVLMLEADEKQTQSDMNQLSMDMKNKLEAARDEYAAALEVLKRKQGSNALQKWSAASGQKSVYLRRIESIWQNYYAAVQLIINSNVYNNDLTDAFDYIGKYSKELCKLADKLQEQFLISSIRMERFTERMEIGMIVLLFLLIAFYLYHLIRFIILPYNQLYKGITEIGLSSYQVNQNSPTKSKVIPLVNEVSNLFLKIDYLISLIENINNNNSFMETLTYISETFSVFIPYNYIGIALISEDGNTLRASYGVSDQSITGLPEKIMGVAWPVKETSLEPYLESGEARIINDLEKYTGDTQMKPYNKILLEAGVRASIALPLKVSGEPVGMIFFSSKDKDVYTTDHLKILGTLANSIAISLNQNILSNEMQYSSILALAKLSEARDEDTGEHMERMAKYSRKIAQLLYENQIYTEEITLEYIDRIERFSPLHDIGKVGIVDDILLKPGKLTPEEFDRMKKHTLYGAQVLKSADRNMIKKGISVFGMGSEIAEGHHEKWDGSGYPYGKKGSEIPLSARIAAIADVFDALTSKRPYKEAFSLDKSFAIIEAGKGTHFDPVIIEVFLKNRSEIEEIYHKYQKK